MQVFDVVVIALSANEVFKGFVSESADRLHMRHHQNARHLWLEVQRRQHRDFILDQRLCQLLAADKLLQIVFKDLLLLLLLLRIPILLH